MADSSFKEQRIRKITDLYYSNPEVQKAIFEFSKNREISPRYFEGFGKRPDSFQYQGDVFEMVKKGATSFHCSEELWEDPLNIVTGMNEQELNNLRIGWDLLMDIDCKWFDYAKIAALAIITVFNNHGIKNLGIKFSGNKGFHIILPWKSIPKEIAGQNVKDLFPSLPRKIISYIRFKAREEMEKILPEDFYERIKDVKIKKGYKKCNICNEIAEEINLVNYFCNKCHRNELRRLNPEDKTEYKCPDCRVAFEVCDSVKKYKCNKCNISHEEKPENFSPNVEDKDLFEVLGLDVILVSPRHLFRMPYSLHEKTALASIVLTKEEIKDFELKDANALKVKIRNFLPDAIEGEAKELVREALDWTKNNEIKSGASNDRIKGKYADFKPIKLMGVNKSQFPPCINKILEGIGDGKKRALFALINFFRSIGLDKEDMEKRLNEWNKKNKPLLKQGYITSQLSWAYKRKPLMPPNCKEYYQGLGVCVPDEFCRSTKNPVNYAVKRNYFDNQKKNNKFKKKN